MSTPSPQTNWPLRRANTLTQNCTQPPPPPPPPPHTPPSHKHGAIKSILQLAWPLARCGPPRPQINTSAEVPAAGAQLQTTETTQHLSRGRFQMAAPCARRVRCCPKQHMHWPGEGGVITSSWESWKRPNTRVRVVAATQNFALCAHSCVPMRLLVPKACNSRTAADRMCLQKVLCLSSRSTPTLDAKAGQRPCAGTRQPHTRQNRLSLGAINRPQVRLGASLPPPCVGYATRV